ncbi:MAG: hypothetical protein ACKOYL_10390, partial [Actinomycetota bacterium]
VLLTLTRPRTHSCVLDWFHVGFRESAFKHGQSREDILHALGNKLSSHRLQPRWGQDRELALGPNLQGVLIEVIVSINYDSIDVFHAQPNRSSKRKGETQRESRKSED